MSHRLIGAAALLVVLGVGAVLVPGLVGDDDAPATGAASQAGAAASGSPLPSTGPSADPVGGAATPSPSPSPAAGRVTTEVVVEPPTTTSGSTGPSETGPGSLSAQPSLSTETIGKLPTRATTTRGVVAGWPKRALPVIAGSRVRSTSVSPGPGVVQLGLDAVVGVDPAAVLRRYRSALSAFGFVEQPSVDPNAGTAIAFTHGTDSVTLTVASAERGTSYVVFAVLHPES